MNATDHIRDLCQIYRVRKADLLGPSKRRIWVTLRQELYFRLVILRGLSTPQAGRRIGRRDHTTVLYGLRRYAHRMFGTSLKASLEQIRETARWAGFAVAQPRGMV